MSFEEYEIIVPVIFVTGLFLLVYICSLAKKKRELENSQQPTIRIELGDRQSPTILTIPSVNSLQSVTQQGGLSPAPTYSDVVFGLPTYEDAISQLNEKSSIKSDNDSEGHIEIKIRNRKLKQVAHVVVVTNRLRRISLKITQD